MAEIHAWRNRSGEQVGVSASVGVSLTLCVSSHVASSLKKGGKVSHEVCHLHCKYLLPSLPFRMVPKVWRLKCSW